MRKISLKFRLTLWYTALMISVSAIVLTAITSFNQTMIDKDAERRLVRSVDNVAMLMRDSRTNNINRTGPMNNGPGDFPHRNGWPKLYADGVHMVMLDKDQNVVEGQIPFSITDELDFEDGIVRKNIYDGNKYLVYDREIILSNGSNAYIKGFISIDENNYAIASVLRNNLILTVVLILIAAAGGYFITSRALRPVSLMNGTAKMIIKSKDLTQRINAGKANDEISELAYTFDEMLSEIQSSFERERQFTSDASHELRTPIAVILSECEYMTDCADSVEELKASAESVKEEAQRMSKLVSELLMVSRMDKEILKPNFEETELSDLVGFICDEQVEINGDSIMLERHIAPNITAQADRFLIARLFINLISNAYQYNRDHGTIKVSLYEKDEDIVFSVSDTGVGIAEENLPKIWARFYQVESSRAGGENGGTGLGLSMVKWIAEKHNGKLAVESELGVGSTFTFIFPKEPLSGQ